MSSSSRQDGQSEVIGLVLIIAIFFIFLAILVAVLLPFTETLYSQAVNDEIQRDAEIIGSDISNLIFSDSTISRSDLNYNNRVVYDSSSPSYSVSVDGTGVYDENIGSIVYNLRGQTELVYHSGNLWEVSKEDKDVFRNIQTMRLDFREDKLYMTVLDFELESISGTGQESSSLPSSFLIEETDSRIITEDIGSSSLITVEVGNTVYKREWRQTFSSNLDFTSSSINFQENTDSIEIDIQNSSSEIEELVIVVHEIKIR